MPVDEKDAIEEIKIRMPGVTKSHALLKLTGEVANFLSDVDQVHEPLVSLNAAMQLEAEDRLKSALDVGEAINLIGSKRKAGFKLPPHLQNLLSTVLTRVEVKNDFSLGEKERAWADGPQPTAVTYVNYVQPDQFRANLQERMPFKDPTVPGGHGEFTHRIQWYCLMMTKRGFSKPAELSWSDYYAWVGSVVHQNAEKDDQSSWNMLGLWDAVFDRDLSGAGKKNGPYETTEETDFRSPNNLQRFLTSNQSLDYQMLSAFLIARTEKRNSTNLTISVAAAKQYIAKKTFGMGVVYNDLAKLDKQKVDDIYNGAQLAAGLTFEKSREMMSCILS